MGAVSLIVYTIRCYETYRTQEPITGPRSRNCDDDHSRMHKRLIRGFTEVFEKRASLTRFWSSLGPALVQSELKIAF